MQVTRPAEQPAERIERIERESLAPDVQRLLETLDERGPALLAADGMPEAAVMDIVDFRLLRAAVRFYANPPHLAATQLEADPSDEAVATLGGEQARYDLVLAHLLAGGLSLSRAAELLGTAYVDLRLRLHRLGLPTLQRPTNIEDAREEVRVARSIWDDRRP